MSMVHKILDVLDNSDDALLIEGKHGIGKSDMATEWANERGYHITTLFPSTQEVGDLLGLPIIVNDTTNWGRPIWLQEMHEAYWPTTEIQNLIFEDKDFERFVISKIQ